MKYLIKFFIMMAVLCAITACSQAFEDVSNNKKKQETTKGRLVMKVGSKSRTILPDISIVESDIKTARLTANGTEIKSWSGSGIIEQIENEDDILLDVGIYDFEMTFYNENGNVFLMGTIDNKEIKAGDNFIIFDMKVPVTGNGNIAIEINWEADDRINIVRAGLYDVETDEVIPAYKSETLKTVGTQAIYFKENIPAGQYIIKFEIYDNMYNLLNTLTDVVKITNGKTSVEQKTLSNINTLYTITYNLNGGSWKSGFTPVTVRNVNTGVALPTYKNITKTGYKLSGWYTDETFSGEKIEIIPSGMTADITLYAKYEDCYVVTAEDVPQTIAGLAAGGPYNILVTGTLTSDTISSIKTALQNNSSTKVNLDFSDTTGLTSIGDGVHYNGAFSGCSSLESVVIPDSVTSIGWYAFSGCSSLTSVVIGNSVTSIGTSAFDGCSSLKSVVIPDSVTSIGGSAFSGCSSLTSVTIPDSVTYIGGSAFNGCSSLTSVTIGDSVTSIGSYAFYGCSSLTSVTIGNSVTSIGNRAFYKCSNLTSVTIPDGVTSIGTSAFDGCSSLTSVMIPDSVTSIGQYAFKDCCNLTNLRIDTNNPNYSSSDDGKILYNKDKNKLLAYPSATGDVTIPDSVTSIGDGAFYKCSSLTSVVIPDSVTYIGGSAFDGCSSLTSVYITDLEAWCNIKFSTDSTNPLCYGANLYLNGSLVKDLVIPDSVTSIGERAFYSCSSLTSVTIPDSVTSIGSSTFQSCSSLTSVTIPDSVTSIGSSTFQSCSSLTSVTIPDSVTSIGNYAFDGCSKLTNVTFKDTNNWYYTNNSDYTDGTAVDVTDKAQNATYLKSTYKDKYWYKYLETTVTVTADNVTDAISKLSTGGNHTVKVTGAITSDTISSIKTALQNNSLAYVNLDLSDTTGLTSIGEDAFRGCSSLTSVTIGDSVTSISYGAFRGCSSLTNVTFKDTNNWYYTSNSNYTGGTAVDVTDKAQNATYLKSTYRDKYWYKYLETTVTVTADNVTDAISKLSTGGNHTVKVTGAITSDTISAIKTALQNNSLAYVNLDLSDTTGLTSIGEWAFSGCSSLTSVTIGDSVTSIGNSAFDDCSSLASVTIGDSVTSIGNSAFDDCSSLASVTIGDSVTYIGDSAFYKCSSLTSIVIPDSVTSIDSSAFYGCSSLTNVIIPDSVTSISYGAFRGCSSLTSVTIPDSVTYIGGSAFSGCSSLTSVTIPDSVTFIREYAFEYCSNLTSIVIPDSVTSISYDAFRGCSSLTSVTIPDSVTYIGRSAFYNCDSLTNFNVSTNNRYYSASDDGKILYNKDKTKLLAYPSATGNVTIPDSVTSIGERAFYSCDKLTSVVIGDSVTSIDDDAFRGCSSLTSVTIGDSVTSIGNFAFDDCSSLTNVIIPDSVTSISYGAFRGCSSLTSVVTPDSVTFIGEYAFDGCSSLTSVTIPDSVTSIGYAAFNNCSSLMTVNYKGTQEQWEQISIGSYNEYLTNATINYNYTGE